MTDFHCALHPPSEFEMHDLFAKYRSPWKA